MSDWLVADIGNTRFKWGQEHDECVTAMIGVPADETAWARQWAAWRLGPGTRWAVAGVHPGRREAFVAWLGRQGATVRRLDSFRDLPLTVALAQPERVGIDRLLNAVAVNRRRPAGASAIVIDAGSAVTVDYVDSAGVFCGGAIYPGLHLMARALHDYTALLPIVEVSAAASPPGMSTTAAIQAGIYHAVVGGAERLAHELSRAAPAPPAIFLTGGDAEMVAAKFGLPAIVWPEMTLEGILHSVRACEPG